MTNSPTLPNVTEEALCPVCREPLEVTTHNEVGAWQSGGAHVRRIPVARTCPRGCERVVDADAYNAAVIQLERERRLA
jgi:hypothetical protein